MEKLKNGRNAKLKVWRGMIERGGVDLFSVCVCPGKDVIVQAGFLLGAEQMTPELLTKLGVEVGWDETGAMVLRRRMDFLTKKFIEMCVLKQE